MGPAAGRGRRLHALYIYVTHEIALFHLGHVLRLLGVDFPRIEAPKVVPVAAVLFAAA